MTDTPILYTDTYITISRLQVYGRHGVLAQERTVGNDFIVDAEIHYDALKALGDDNIDHALNYAHMIDTIVKTMDEPCDLIEHVAGNIAKSLLTTFPAITHGTISITKVKPPVSSQLGGVSFTVRFTRS